MTTNRMPALVGTGCLALFMSASIGFAQQTPGGSPTTGNTGNPTMGSPNGTTNPGQTGDPTSPTTNNGAMGTSQSGMGGSQSGMDSSGSGGGMSDKHFVKEAMEGSMAEIQMGQLAQQKASSDDVKQFGQRMVQDHQKLNEQMQPIASQMGITPPSDLPAKEKAMQKKLEGLNGAEFDKAYMSMMVKDHKKDMAAFQKEASSGKNPQVKDAAQQGSQIISQHMQMAQEIAQKVGAGSGMDHMHGMKSSHDDMDSGAGNTTSNPK